MASAADAPISAAISVSLSKSYAKTVQIICTSLRKPSGNKGRIGLSIKRDFKVSASEGLPSRRKKPPGILPTAKVFSW